MPTMLPSTIWVSKPFAASKLPRPWGPVQGRNTIKALSRWNSPDGSVSAGINLQSDEQQNSSTLGCGLPRSAAMESAMQLLMPPRPPRSRASSLVAHRLRTCNDSSLPAPCRLSRFGEIQRETAAPRSHTRPDDRGPSVNTIARAKGPIKPSPTKKSPEGGPGTSLTRAPHMDYAHHVDHGTLCWKRPPDGKTTRLMADQDSPVRSGPNQLAEEMSGQ